jgi:Zn-dependent protease with chaperone function
MSTPYVARDPGSNPNISSTPPLKLFAVLGSGALLIVLIAWLILGALVGVVARQVPDSFEAELGSLFAIEVLQDENWSTAQQELQRIVDGLAAQLPLREFKYRVIVIDDPVANAAAVPGGGILVYSGLLRQARSENEVAMVLAHELAHHVHRDHLEGLGRGLVLAVIMHAVLGSSSGLDRLSGAGAQGLALKMSRDDEREADRLGLLLVEEHYGHVGGALDFFLRVGDQPGGRGASWFRTHPLSSDRIDLLHDAIETHGYAVRQPAPLLITMP